MLCSESFLFSFSTHEWNSDPHKLRKHLFFFFLVPPRLVFLVKTGTTYLSHGKSFLCNQIVLSTKCHLSHFLRNPSKPRAYLFCHVCYTYSKHIYQTTQPVQYLNMNSNNAVYMYFVHHDFIAIQLMLLYHIKIKGQQKYTWKLDKLCSSNISNLHSPAINFM